MEIIITGDLLRPNSDGASNQLDNINWFWNLLGYQISRSVADAPVRLLLPGSGEQCFDAEQFFRLNGLDVSITNWAKLYDAAEITDKAREYFFSHFADNLVIGFELPKLFMRLLDEAGLTYIDFIIHPVRFLDDVFFGIRTNNSASADLLRSVSLTDEHFFVQAGLHKATLSRIPSKQIEANACLLVGQTAADRSLISHGKIIDLFEFSNKLATKFEAYSKVYFKPHPYSSDAFEVFRRLSKFGDVELIEENIYKLLADDRIAEVVSISSSVGAEAPYFGRSAEFLFEEPSELFRKESNSQQHECYFPVYDAFFDPAFWQRILAPFFKVKGCQSIQLPPKTSRLRTSLQNHWGYNFLDFNILLKNIEQDQQRQFDFLWRDTFTIAEFIDHEDIDFIRKAFLGILKREPDEVGLESYLRRLREGSLTKESIIARLRFSREGMEKGVRVGGLLTCLVKNAPASCTLLLRRVFR